jgi:predicted nucleic acid-binding protein
MSAMTNIEILEQLKNLPAAERLRIVESTVHELREDMERSGAQAADATHARLARAAEALLGDYSKDRGLTAFTALDGEAIHA